MAAQRLRAEGVFGEEKRTLRDSIRGIDNFHGWATRNGVFDGSRGKQEALTVDIAPIVARLSGALGWFANGESGLGDDIRIDAEHLRDLLETTKKAIVDVRSVFVKPGFMGISWGHSARFGDIGYQMANLSASLAKISFFLDGVYVDLDGVRGSPMDWEPRLNAGHRARKTAIGLRALSDAIDGEAAVLLVLRNIETREDKSKSLEEAKKIHKTAIACLNTALVKMDNAAFDLAQREYSLFNPSREAAEEVLTRVGVIKRD
jgi:hypothetical protein